VLEGIEDTPWATSPEVQLATEAIRRLERRESLASDHLAAVEAIILPNERPVVDVVGGTYDTPAPPFENLGAGGARERIEAAIPSVGRIELPGHPSLPYGGTGFIVGDDLLMTNRHVGTGMVVALHFAGRYLEANYAVPTRELAIDRRVVEAAVNFEGELGDVGPVLWDRYWTDADPPGGPGEAAPVAAPHRADVPHSPGRSRSR
jgi:hypothetical protein